MEWYGYTLIGLCIICVIGFVVFLWRFRSKKLDGVSMEGLLKAEAKFVAIKKRINEQLKEDVNKQDVRMIDALAELKDHYDQQLKGIKDEQIKRFKQLKNDPSSIDTWLDKHLSTENKSTESGESET